MRFSPKGPWKGNWPAKMKLPHRNEERSRRERNCTSTQGEPEEKADRGSVDPLPSARPSGRRRNIVKARAPRAVKEVLVTKK